MTVSIISITFILVPFVFLLGWYMETNYRHLSRRMKGKPESPVVWCWVKDIALGFLISIAPWFILLFAALIILSIGDEPLLASLWPPIAWGFYYFYLRLFIKHYNSVHPNGWMAILSNKVANKLAPHKNTIKKWSFRLIGCIIVMIITASIMASLAVKHFAGGMYAVHTMDVVLQNYMDKKEQNLQTSLSRLNKEDIPHAAQTMRKQIQDLQSRPDAKEIVASFSEKDITMDGALQALGVRSFIDQFIAIFEKKNTPGEVAVMKALVNGKNIATWRANGKVYSVPLSPRIKTDNLTDEQAAQRYVDNFDESREAEIASIIYN